MLPDFIVIGAPRSGTTSLYRAVIEHPEIAGSFRKEMHYFDGRTDRGVAWYRAGFPLSFGPMSPKFTGEATPNYLAYSDAPREVAALLPDVRLVAVLRDPIERAHSAWRLMVFEGRETRSFSEAIYQEAENPITMAERRDRVGVARSPQRLAFGYLEKCRYSEHLERWLAEFDQQKLLILKSEDLFDDPATCLNRVISFVGANTSVTPPLGHYYAAPTTDIEARDREWLRQYFAPYNRKLEELTGLAFGWDG